MESASVSFTTKKHIDSRQRCVGRLFAFTTRFTSTSPQRTDQTTAIQGPHRQQGANTPNRTISSTPTLNPISLASSLWTFSSHSPNDQVEPQHHVSPNPLPIHLRQPLRPPRLRHRLRFPPPYQRGVRGQARLHQFLHCAGQDVGCLSALCWRGEAHRVSCRLCYERGDVLG